MGPDRWAIMANTSGPRRIRSCGQTSAVYELETIAMLPSPRIQLGSLVCVCVGYSAFSMALYRQGAGACMTELRGVCASVTGGAWPKAIASAFRFWAQRLQLPLLPPPPPPPSGRLGRIPPGVALPRSPTLRSSPRCSSSHKGEVSLLLASNSRRSLRRAFTPTGCRALLRAKASLHCHLPFFPPPIGTTIL